MDNLAGSVVVAKSREQDKFVVRLPDGMRERIKSKADRAGMSMNEAIVWCLDSFFPAPQTFDDRMHELAEMVAILKEDGRENEALDNMIHKVHETLRDIQTRKLKTPPDFKGEILERLNQWDEERYERERYYSESPFEDPGGDLDDGDPKL